MRKKILLSIVVSFLVVGCGSGSGSGNDSSTGNNANSSDIQNININKPEKKKISDEELMKKQELIESPNSKDGLSINEVLAYNAYTNLDPDFNQFSDWIELYNNSDASIDLGGYYLSDKDNNITKWQFPTNTKIDANSYLLVWADKKNVKQKELHTNFKLSSKDSIILSDDKGTIIDSYILGKQKGDISSSVVNNKVYYSNPTPKSRNTTAYAVLIKAKKPIFSPENGFFDTTTTVELTQPNGGEIYYTLDGSTPTPKSTKYTQPITIDKTTVIRTVAVEDRKLVSGIRTKTYILNHQTTLPVVSLVTDPSFLFDDMIGIYVEGKNGVPLTQCHKDETIPRNFATDWIRPVHVEYFDEEQKKAFSLSLDFGIGGQCSRLEKKKMFSFDVDSKYNEQSIKYKLFDDKPMIEYKDFKIRSGRSGYEIGDTLAPALAREGNLNIDYQSYKVIQIFVNGEYWGLYNIREKKGKDYIKGNYPNTGKLDIFNSHVKAGDKIDYNILNKYLSNNDLTDNNNYLKVLDMVDEDNFIDYMCLMIYSANYDWLGGNYRLWKEKKAGSKWRFMLDDIDSGFQTDSRGLNANFFNVITSRSSTIVPLLFNKLSQNTIFKAKFKNRFNELLNTIFMPQRVEKIIDEMTNKKRDYIELEKDKWNITLKKFDTYINEVRTFAQQRRDIVKSNLDNF